jgi:hypothetical protein
VIANAKSFEPITAIKRLFSGAEMLDVIPEWAKDDR